MFIDKDCAERGCACYDDRIDKNQTEVIDLKENYTYLVFDETGTLVELYLPKKSEDAEVPEKISKIINIGLNEE